MKLRNRRPCRRSSTAGIGSLTRHIRGILVQDPFQTMAVQLEGFLTEQGLMFDWSRREIFAELFSVLVTKQIQSLVRRQEVR